MDKKIGVSVALIVLILLSVVGFFAFQTVQTTKVEKFIAQRQKALKQANQAIQEGVTGKTYVTALFPTQVTGQEKNTAQEAIYNHVKKKVGQKKPASRIDTLLFVHTQSEASPFANVSKLTVGEESYRIKGLTISKKSETRLQEVLVTADGQLFQLPTLFADFEAAKPHLTEALKGQLVANGVSEVAIETYLGQFMALDWSKVGVSYADGHLQLALPEKEVGAPHLQIPVSNLFDLLTPQHVPVAEASAYEAHVTHKALQGQKLVALTFDDGPDAVNTPRVLELLKQYKAKGTFFVLGRAIEGNEDLLKRIVTEGHEVGNHTFTHPDLTTISPEEVHQEVGQTQAAIKAVLGKEPTIMRPPYGAVNASVSAAMNLPAIHWSVDTEDWVSHNPSEILHKVKTHTQAGGIVLMHDIHAETVDALEGVLQYLASEGYTFVTISQLLGTNLNPHSIYFDQHSFGPTE